MHSDSLEKRLSSATAGNKHYLKTIHKRDILAFQLLLFCSILFSIAAGIFFGALPAVLAATFFCASAFAYHSRTMGLDGRALFACALFYLLALFFISAKFLTQFLSFTLVPFAAVAFAALILAFRFLVYNKAAEGIVVGRHGRFTIVDVHQSPWHSFSGAQVFESSSAFAEGTGVKLDLKSGAFSPPRICGIHPL